MKLFLKALHFIYWLYATLLFIALMLLIFPFVILASLFGFLHGGNMIYNLCIFWATTWFVLVGIRIKKIYVAKHDKSRPYIFVSNHISWLDGPLVTQAFPQKLRALGKVEMSKIPVFGFIYKEAIVTVDRSCPENRAKSIQTLKEVIGHGISVLVFPEGTFNMTPKPLRDFYDGAFRIAIETQTPVKPVLFLDAHERLNYKTVFSLNPGRCRIVYLEEIPVQGLGSEHLPALKEQVYTAMEKKLMEYQVSWVEAGSPATNS